MSDLRPTSKLKVHELLDQTYFTRHGFLVTFSDKGEEGTVVKIDFITNPKYSYLIGKNYSGIYTEESPSIHFASGERFKRQNFTEALEGILPWAERIMEDYKSQNPIFDEFTEFRESIESQLRDHAEEVNNHFTDGEKEALNNKLDELSNAYAELAKTHKLKDRELEKIKAEIEDIKNDLKIFPKGLWIRTAGNRILKALGGYVSSKEGRQLVIGAAKKLLIGDGGDGS